jgi:hypothetical protein
MTFVKLSDNILMPTIPRGISGLPSFTNSAMNVQGERHGILFQAPKSGNIRKIGWRSGTTMNASNVFSLRVETVSLDTGYPSGTLWGTNTEKTGITGLATSTYYEETLDADATVSFGDLMAVVITCTTLVGNSSASVYSDGAGTAELLPACFRYTGTWGSNLNGTPILHVEYDDGSIEQITGVFPIDSVTSTPISSTSNPRMTGNKIRLPYKAKIDGAWLWTDTDSDMEVRLYNTSGTILGKVELDKDVPAATTGIGYYFALFDSPVELEANTDYYIMYIALDTINCATYDISALDASVMAGAMPAGSTMTRVTTSTATPTSSSDFTGDDTRQTCIGIIMSEIDIPAGGGGGIQIARGRMG